MIDRERREDLKRIKNRMSYLHSLVGEWMIRQNVATKVGINSEQLIIEKDRYGKPYFLNFPEVHFNISHSGEWVLGILSKGKCGIDVEQIKEVRMDIARRFFAKEEYEMLLQKKGKEQRQLFYELWTLKESYVKYKGKGLTLPFWQFCFEKNGNEWTLKRNLLEACWFCEVEVAAGYVSYVCVDENEKNEQEVVLGEKRYKCSRKCIVDCEQIDSAMELI